MIYRNEIENEDAADTVGWIEKAGQKALLIRGDIINESFCQSAIQQTVETLGRYDILIKNAAYQMTYNSVTDISDSEWSKIYGKTNWNNCKIIIALVALEHIYYG